MSLPLRTFYVLALAASCAVWSCGATPGNDLPVPRSETRETMTVLVDLPKTASCTEQFDLAVYANRAIEMIEWTSGTGAPTKADAPDCEQRVVQVRFLNRRISKDEVLSLLRANAVRVAEAPKNASGPAPAKGTP